MGGVKPALGLAWAEQVTVRLMMTRSEGVGDETELQQVEQIEWSNCNSFHSNYCRSTWPEEIRAPKKPAVQYGLKYAYNRLGANNLLYCSSLVVLVHYTLCLL